MARKNSYQQMQWYLIYMLIAAVGMFALYLVFAAFGVIWLKVITAILAILISFACLAYLYMTKELLRPRSLWISAAAAAIIVCLLFSLILNFPSPYKYKNADTQSDSPSVVAICENEGI